jgi:hypothetical protein
MSSKQRLKENIFSTKDTGAKSHALRLLRFDKRKGLIYIWGQ